MATSAQIIFTRLAALAIAIVIGAWLWGDGSGWLAAIAAGVGGYILSKIGIALLIGLRQGLKSVPNSKQSMDALRRDKEGRRR